MREERSAAAVDRAGSTAAAGFDWVRLLSSRWIVGAVVISFLIEGAIIYCLRLRSPNETAIVAGEIPIGTFEFSRSGAHDNRLYRGQFDLYVRVSDDLNSAEQRQFLQAERQLQQGVEESLRRLRTADFTDPRLTRLKIRVQQRLNDELGFEGISEVLIANFKIDARQPPVTSAASHDAESVSEPDGR
ncbi:MAG TPA: hypothetical protein VG056_14655 [Pirellulales bacterium]|nr:hypothetical protein [Pirellulales bacterium]